MHPRRVEWRWRETSPVLRLGAAENRRRRSNDGPNHRCPCAETIAVANRWNRRTGSVQHEAGEGVSPSACGAKRPAMRFKRAGGYRALARIS